LYKLLFCFGGLSWLKMCWLTVIIGQRYSFQNGGHFYIKITVVK